MHTASIDEILQVISVNVGFNSLFYTYVMTENWMKTKKFGPSVGGGSPAPPRSANGIETNITYRV